nr:ADP-ribosylglycohydrolase family protein [Bacillus mojavensis]
MLPFLHKCRQPFYNSLFAYVLIRTASDNIFWLHLSSLLRFFINHLTLLQMVSIRFHPQTTRQLAANLGKDTDTVALITGSIAGIYYKMWNP